jgi:hypothetical protein
VEKRKFYTLPGLEILPLRRVHRGIPSNYLLSQYSCSCPSGTSEVTDVRYFGEYVFIGKSTARAHILLSE